MKKSFFFCVLYIDTKFYVAYPPESFINPLKFWKFAHLLSIYIFMSIITTIFFATTDFQIIQLFFP